MSAKKPLMSDEKRRSLLCDRFGVAIRGIKIHWNSILDQRPFADGLEAHQPNRCLKAGTGKKN